MRYIYSLLLLVAVTFGSAWAQDEHPRMNMTLFGHLNPVDSTGPHSALWGYAAPDGREYALFASQAGTHIVDITTQPIRQVDFIPGPRSAWREMKVYGDLAYVVTEHRDVELGAGLQIIDLSELPARATLLRTDTSEFVSAHTIYIRDHYMYVMGTAPEAGANRGAIILDLEPDPLHPRRVGVVDPYYYHDAFVRNDTLLGAAVQGQGLDIYDISDKSEPVHLTTIKYPYSGTHNAELTRDGRYVVSSDEVSFTPKTLKVWDISDIENVTKVADYTPAPGEIIHNVHIDGRYAFVAWYTAGIRVIDMIDPTHPRQVGYYDTYLGGNGGFNGVWEVYPFFPSGKIIASDRQTGLWVVEFNGATAASVSGVVRDSVTGEPLAGVELFVAETNETIVTDFSGAYYVGGVDGQTLTVSGRKFGYAGFERTITLDGDRMQDILMLPLEFRELVVTAHDTLGAPINDFQVAIEPYIHATPADNGTVYVRLPVDSTYTFTIGRWGYDVVEMPVTVVDQGQAVDATLGRRYIDNATLDLGWSLGVPGDEAITGQWIRTVPHLGYFNSGWVHPENGPSGRSYDYVFMTGDPPINQPPQRNDVNQGTVTLLSPRFDLTDHRDPWIHFDLWFVQYENDTIIDSMVVEVSNNDGESWKMVYSEVQGRGGWDTVGFRVEDYVRLSDRMRVRVRLSDSVGNVVMFAAVDNFEVLRSSLGPPIPLDTSDPLNPGTTDGDTTSITSLRMIVTPVPSSISPEVVVWSPIDVRVRLELYNELGQRMGLLHNAQIAGGELRLRLPENLPSGWYVVRALGSDGTMVEMRAVIAR